MTHLFHTLTKGTIYPHGNVYIGWLPNTAEYNDAPACVVASCKGDLDDYRKHGRDGVRLFYLKDGKFKEIL